MIGKLEILYSKDFVANNSSLTVEGIKALADNTTHEFGLDYDKSPKGPSDARHVVRGAKITLIKEGDSVSFVVTGPGLHDCSVTNISRAAEMFLSSKFLNPGEIKI